MRYVKQSRVSTPDGSQHGNCLVACVASLAGVDIEDVPDFSNAGSEWFPIMYQFLKDHGMEFEGTRYVYIDSFVYDLINYEGVDGHVIVCGASHREFVKRGHAVLYKDGKCVHDPHPENNGLRSIEYMYLIRRNNGNI